MDDTTRCIATTVFVGTKRWNRYHGGRSYSELLGYSQLPLGLAFQCVGVMTQVPSNLSYHIFHLVVITVALTSTGATTRVTANLSYHIFHLVVITVALTSTGATTRVTANLSHSDHGVRSYSQLPLGLALQSIGVMTQMPANLSYHGIPLEYQCSNS